MKKILKFALILIVCLLTITVTTLYILDYGYLLKAVRVTYLTGHKSAFLEDYKYFDNRVVAVSTPQPWPRSQNYNRARSTISLDSIHQIYGTVAYAIIKNDSVWFEKYYDGYSDSSLSNSFSMAKSIVAACLGKAHELGYIKSLDDKVIHYLPYLNGSYAPELTIRHLVSMQSGLEWDEKYYSPLSITTKAYFYHDLSTAMLELPIFEKPGQRFKYQSGDTQLLAMVLSKALPMPLSEFMSTYFWQPMGAEQEALWQYNKSDGVEKAYCCIASNALDFARFGRLYANQGSWDGQQILSEDYISQSVIPSSLESPEYGFGWWLGEYMGKKTITMNGHLGQYVIAIPEDDIIIVRLGHRTDRLGMGNPESVFYQYIDQAYRMLRDN